MKVKNQGDTGSDNNKGGDGQISNSKTLCKDEKKDNITQTDIRYLKEEKGDTKKKESKKRRKDLTKSEIKYFNEKVNLSEDDLFLESDFEKVPSVEEYMKIKKKRVEKDLKKTSNTMICVKISKAIRSNLSKAAICTVSTNFELNVIKTMLTDCGWFPVCRECGRGCMIFWYEDATMVKASKLLEKLNEYDISDRILTKYSAGFIPNKFWVEG